MLETLTKDSFTQAIQNGVCMVAVGAPWCPDCRKIEPIPEILMQEYGAKLRFYHVQADEEAELKESLNIRRIPTLIFYKNGTEIHERLIEPNSKDYIEQAIKAALEA